MLNTFAVRSLTLSLISAFFAAHAGTVAVVTSFPKELTAIYKKAFEAKNPDIKIEILNKNTTAGIAVRSSATSPPVILIAARVPAAAATYTNCGWSVQSPAA